MPEVLVYWSAGSGDVPEALPPASHLIGSLRGSMTGPLELPRQAAQAASGQLVLYVLSRTRILGVVRLHPPAGVFGADTAPGNQP